MEEIKEIEFVDWKDASKEMEEIKEIEFIDSKDATEEMEEIKDIAFNDSNDAWKISTRKLLQWSCYMLWYNDTLLMKI